MEGIGGRRGPRHAWVASRSLPLARSRARWPLSVSCEAQEGGGGGGEGVTVTGFQAAARPWAAASAGCFDHAGAVAVSFCSRGSSRAAGRPPWGPALPRPPPAARTREGGRGAWPGRLQAPPDAPSSPPVAPRAAASCWGGGAGRPQLPLRRGAGGGGAGPGARASWERRRPRRGAPQPTPLGPPTRSLTPRMHTLGRRRCCAPADGRAERRARTTAAGSRARRRHARTHAGHTRAHRTHTHGPHTRGLSTRAHTPTHARTAQNPLSPAAPQVGPMGPGTASPLSVATPFPSWVP